MRHRASGRNPAAARARQRERDVMHGCNNPGPIDHRREIVSAAGTRIASTTAEHPVTPGPRNLLTDIAGIRVGHADDARIATGTTAIIFDEPTVVSADIGGGGPGHPRDRPARSLPHGRAHRCHHALRRLGLRARRRGRRAGLSAQHRPRLCGRKRAGAAGAGGDPVRSPQRRRQGVGPLPALSRARLCGGRGGAHRLRARQRRRRARRHHGQLQGRHRLGLGEDRRRLHRGGARRGQRRRWRGGRRRPVVLGGAFRARRRIRRPRLPRTKCPRRPCCRAPRARRA